MLVNVEQNTMMHYSLLRMKMLVGKHKRVDRMYKNLYIQKDLTIVDPQVQLSQGFDLKGKDKMVLGFSTTEKHDQ